MLSLAIWPYFILMLNKTKSKQKFPCPTIGGSIGVHGVSVWLGGGVDLVVTLQIYLQAILDLKHIDCVHNVFILLNYITTKKFTNLTFID